MISSLLYCHLYDQSVLSHSCFPLIELLYAVMLTDFPKVKRLNTECLLWHSKPFMIREYLPPCLPPSPFVFHLRQSNWDFLTCQILPCSLTFHVVFLCFSLLKSTCTTKPFKKPFPNWNTLFVSVPFQLCMVKIYSNILEWEKLMYCHKKLGILGVFGFL